MDDSLCLCGLIKALAVTCERELNDALTELGISHCQAGVLLKILHAGPLTMSAVSRQLCCHKSNVTQVVDGLALKDLIERKASAKDRRVCSLALTRKGKVISMKAHVLLNHRAEKCVDALDARDQMLLRNLLKKMLEKNAK